MTQKSHIFVQSKTCCGQKVKYTWHSFKKSCLVTSSCSAFFLLAEKVAWFHPGSFRYERGEKIQKWEQIFERLGKAFFLNLIYVVKDLPKIQSGKKLYYIFIALI